MKPKIIEKAKKIIENNRYEAEREALGNKEEALKDSIFKKMYIEYINMLIENAKNNITDKSAEEGLKSLYQQRLKELKIGSIEPIYSCVKCHDIGFIENKYCDCLIDEINKILKLESGFLELEDFNDSNFDLFENKDLIKKLYEKMQKWCNSNFEKNIIFLSGPTGVGKTHLVKCMANELIKRHKLILLTTSFAMHQDFVKSYACKDAEEKQNLLSRYIDAEILFIDDLGTELRNPNVTVSYLYQIINERRLKGKPTVITTNLSLADTLQYYDERIYSRIADTTSSICIYLNGDDLRLKKK